MQSCQWPLLTFCLHPWGSSAPMDQFQTMKNETEFSIQACSVGVAFKCLVTRTSTQV